MSRANKRPKSKTNRAIRAKAFLKSVQTLAEEYGLLEDSKVNSNDVCVLSLKHDGIMIFIKMFYDPYKTESKAKTETSTTVTKTTIKDGDNN